MKSYPALAKSRIISDAQSGHVRPALQPDHVEGPYHEDGGDHRGADPDDQRNGEAPHRARADQIQDARREGGADVRIDDGAQDRKSTRLNSSHVRISYA